ncbi:MULTISPECIES: hypothetical protein [Amycolatopsis]|uniref:Uncharacterized protein n=1 Tax=Amycolatopsis albidoflavus TaxID=102226 RepID=A0ABW5HX26_9PSEU
MYWQSAILRQACFSALLISLVLAALAVLGLFVRPHWLWAVPIGCAVLSLLLALRLRLATTRGTVAVLSTAVLVLVVAAGCLAGLAAHLTQRS